MRGPLWLLGGEGIQHLLKAALQPGCFKASDRLVRTFVEWRVAKHQPAVLRMAHQDLPEGRMEGLASLAERVENSTTVTRASALPMTGECGRT
ncbi:MAG TPA: hypothetical protein VNZ61_25990 [Roseomonas sp.]|nr:hypothetical protein [Roseomonas sp.]